VRKTDLAQRRFEPTPQGILIAPPLRYLVLVLGSVLIWVWFREVEAPIARFERGEAHRLKPLGGRPSFGSLRELTCVVGNDCAVEIDTNSYSVPWRLIGERVAVTVAAGEVRIRHGVREVAVHKQSQGRRLRIVDSAHVDGVAGRDGAVCRVEIAAPTVPASSPPPSLLRPLAEYEAAIGGSF
jgi:hypothetical protein